MKIMFAGGLSLKKVLAVAATVTVLFGAEVSDALKEVGAQQNSAKASQKRIDAYSDEKSKLYESYRQVTQESDRVKAYNDQMQRFIDSQVGEIGDLDAQINEIEYTNQSLIPLMQRMIATLEQFVSLDIPFLHDERTERVAQLRILMDEASVTLAEKYRKIMEAYSLENEYSRTIEAYRAELKNSAGNRTVDFLRIGRTGLYYQTIDGEESGMWDNTAHAWKILENTHKSAIKSGLMIAKKQAAPDLLVLPVNAAEAIK